MSDTSNPNSSESGNPSEGGNQSSQSGSRRGIFDSLHNAMNEGAKKAKEAAEKAVPRIEACKGGPRTQSDFGYAGTLTEGLLVGFLALRTGKRIDWDSKTMKAKGCPEADQFIHPEFRKGWQI